MTCIKGVYFLVQSMATIIFVHGTGNRKEAYVQAFRTIESALSQRKSTAKLIPCLWGEVLGTKLNARGASIPNYNDTKGGANSQNEIDFIKLWQELYKDPWYEIRLLSFKPLPQSSTVSKKIAPSQEIANQVNELKNSSLLLSKFEELGITEEFYSAIDELTTTTAYARLLERATRPLEDEYIAISRAIVAQTIFLCKEKDKYKAIIYDADLRDEIVNDINNELTSGAERGIVTDFVKSQVTHFVKYKGTQKIERERGALTDSFYPFAGDILFYQAKGKKIRDFIYEEMKNAEPPVVLLGHSLGGIACFELLIERQLPQVELLITVGSQAPFLYEIDSLQTLAYGEPLPERFPKWLNIYDLRDILSYLGNVPGIFPGKVTDVRVDNKQPFPESHGAYWYTKETWDEIIKALS
ncbi:MAG: hypothetical protein KME64_08180 [Scytonematopsis contorta HA4267-MV1]|nr:hypothetical protein [Scytonematopsis contorta HA4267-MV1]